MDREADKTEDWLSRVVEGAAVITVNRRLARHLNQRYEQYQVTHDQALWQTPTIMPMSAWLESVWFNFSDAVDSPLTSSECLLTPFQSSLIWKRVINSQRQTFHSKSDDELAVLAQKAWLVISEWQVPLASLQSDHSPNVEAFSRWLASYLRFCSEHNWIDHATLPSRVLALLANDGVCPKEREYVFAGFDEFSPRQKAIIQLLQQQGNRVDVLDFPDVGGAVDRRVYHDVEDELLAAAVWATDIVIKNPQATIGIVVPALARQREWVITQFENVLHPSARLAYGSFSERFNVTLGRSLAEYPLIRAIYSAFALTEPLIQIDVISNYLLNAYFVRNENELCARSVFDCELRNVDELWLTLEIVNQQIVKCQYRLDLANLSNQISVLVKFQQHEQLYPSQWCLNVAELLHCLGWARGLELTSEEYQQHSAWQRVLDQFSQLDSVSGELTWGTALSLLYKMTADTIFQPEAEVVPIHIMGLFETAGLTFDYLWVMGLQDDVLPSSPSPNPLIPMWLQKKFDMPHSSSEREFHYAASLMARLSVCSKEVVLSCALHQEGNELRPSPFLNQTDKLISHPSSGQAARDGLMSSIFETRVVEPWLDTAPPFSGKQIKGGASVFKNQSACPFKAFSYHRLSVQAMNVPKIGLNALERGILIHGVLERFWREVGGYQKLILLADEALDYLISDVVEKEISILCRRKPITFTPRFYSMEKKRLKVRVREWLALEKTRPPFEVVVVEDKQKINIEGLEFTIKIDRIDRLQDGMLLLIDYKTGQTQVKSWFGERPDDPQLPLYAVAFPEGVSGLAFGQLKVGAMGFKGLSASAEVPGGIELFSKSKYSFGDAGWVDLLDEWRGRIFQLAREFSTGVAQVDPKEGVKTCQYCDLASLCRVKAMSESAIKINKSVEDAE